MKKALLVDGERIKRSFTASGTYSTTSHEAFVLGHSLWKALINYIYYAWLTGPGICKATHKIIARCVVCQKNNPQDRPPSKERREILPRTVPI